MGCLQGQPFFAYKLGKTCLSSRTGLFEGLVQLYTEVQYRAILTSSRGKYCPKGLDTLSKGIG